MTGPVYIYRATLYRVVDGDTYELQVDLGFRCYARLMIRLRDYACPELRELGGQAAATYATELLTGAQLLVQSYKDQQSFARWVADVWLPDGLSVGQLLVAAGHATRVSV
jgi:micrococcal nuclease